MHRPWPSGAHRSPAPWPHLRLSLVLFSTVSRGFPGAATDESSGLFRCDDAFAAAQPECRHQAAWCAKLKRRALIPPACALHLHLACAQKRLLQPRTFV